MCIEDFRDGDVGSRCWLESGRVEDKEAMVDCHRDSFIISMLQIIMHFKTEKST